MAPMHPRKNKNMCIKKRSFVKASPGDIFRGLVLMVGFLLFGGAGKKVEQENEMRQADIFFLPSVSHPVITRFCQFCLKHMQMPRSTESFDVQYFGIDEK